MAKGCKKFFGHYDVPKVNVVKNPPTTCSRSNDRFMRVAKNNVSGPVGMGIQIKGQGNK